MGLSSSADGAAGSVTLPDDIILEIAASLYLDSAHYVRNLASTSRHLYVLLLSLLVKKLYLTCSGNRGPYNIFWKQFSQNVRDYPWICGHVQEMSISTEDHPDIILRIISSFLLETRVFSSLQKLTFSFKKEKLDPYDAEKLLLILQTRPIFPVLSHVTIGIRTRPLRSRAWSISQLLTTSRSTSFSVTIRPSDYSSGQLITRLSEGDHFLRFLGSCPRLEELIIHYSQPGCDEHIIKGITQCRWPNLRRLDLALPLQEVTWSPTLTSQFQLFLAAHHLEKVDLGQHIGLFADSLLHLKHIDHRLLPYLPQRRTGNERVETLDLHLKWRRNIHGMRHIPLLVNVTQLNIELMFCYRRNGLIDWPPLTALDETMDAINLVPRVQKVTLAIHGTRPLYPDYREAGMIHCNIEDPDLEDALVSRFHHAPPCLEELHMSLDANISDPARLASRMLSSTSSLKLVTLSIPPRNCSHSYTRYVRVERLACSRLAAVFDKTVDNNSSQRTIKDYVCVLEHGGLCVSSHDVPR